MNVNGDYNFVRVSLINKHYKTFVFIRIRSTNGWVLDILLKLSLAEKYWLESKHFSCIYRERERNISLVRKNRGVDDWQNHKYIATLPTHTYTSYTIVAMVLFLVSRWLNIYCRVLRLHKPKENQRYQIITMCCSDDGSDDQWTWAWSFGDAKYR